jgi:hypothetical protein
VVRKGILCLRKSATRREPTEFDVEYGCFRPHCNKSFEKMKFGEDVVGLFLSRFFQMYLF